MTRRKRKHTESAKERRDRRKASEARRGIEAAKGRKSRPQPKERGNITLTETARRFDPDPLPYYVSGLPDPEAKYEP